MRASTWCKLNLMANKYTLTLFCCLTQVILIKACEYTKAFVFRYLEKWTLIILVCRWRHSGHLGRQEQKHFSSLGSNLYFHVNSSRKQFYCTDPQHGRLVTTWCQRRRRGCYKSPSGDCSFRWLLPTVVINHRNNCFNQNKVCCEVELLQELVAKAKYFLS